MLDTGGTTGQAADSTGSGDEPGPETTGGVIEACLPLELGEELATYGDRLVAYEGCDDRIVIERQGTDPSDPKMLEEAMFGLFGIEGVVGFGSTPCCADAPTQCGNVVVHVPTVPLEDLLPLIDTALEELGDDCAGIVVEPYGLTGPRCEADDPNCLPMPCAFNSKDTVYDPDGPRTPIGSTEGECTHDGDCINPNAGGPECTDWTVFVGPSLGGEECPAEAHCGCLEGSCGWFTQP